MTPVGPLLKDDGPACRVCGCTEHNACVIETGAGEVLQPGQAIAKAVRLPTLRTPPRVLTCSWVRVADSPPHLCSACSGAPEDAVEALDRAMALRRLPTTTHRSNYQTVTVILHSLQKRIKDRLQI